MFKIGELVRTGVYVCNEFVPMALGRIVSVHDGYCDVDVMGLWGGEPWIQSHHISHLRSEEGGQR